MRQGQATCVALRTVTFATTCVALRTVTFATWALRALCTVTFATCPYLTVTHAPLSRSRVRVRSPCIWHLQLSKPTLRVTAARAHRMLQVQIIPVHRDLP